ncbi:MAG: ATP-binding protein [Xanthomonadaceae bacterium]|nr:ATP-binding protein [Xanthomonadaceae bacterium]
MKIKRFEVKGLNKRVKFNFEFHDDLNILTGVNGSGKTTALKLAWYLISGSTVRVRREIEFKYCRLLTNAFDLQLERLPGGDIKYIFSLVDEPETFEQGNFSDPVDIDSDGDVVEDGEDRLSSLIRSSSDRSIFFPTFRRIEGGYSLSKGRARGRTSGLSFSGAAADAGIGAQLEQISGELSYRAHKFVCAVSTDDIAALLTQRYALISEGVNKRYSDFSATILRDIRAWEQGAAESSESESLLLKIQAAANDVDSFRESNLRPFNVLSELVAKLFSYQGVTLKGLALGDAAKAIDSDVLSAGEKQMLSFLVYNAFSTEAPIFIDEPELSLHPDWQRRLFPTLLDQQGSNQFIVSTHSPFIYAKYADRELPINADRGD